MADHDERTAHQMGDRIRSTVHEPVRSLNLGHILTLLVFTFLTGRASAYSVLSHEALVDALWDTEMRPLLLQRYPATTQEQVKIAHGYAYGGAIIQDMGFYPHGSPLFSNLTHYVRSGDFVLALLRQSREPNELAFAMGALCHYIADNDGHRLAVNRAEPLLYPKVRRRFGDSVSYEDNPKLHLATEFGFDVLEAARGNYAPEAYHDFIGFFVATSLLERAFYDTYGLNLSKQFVSFGRAIESYRHVVSKTIPKATRVAWAQRSHEILQAHPDQTQRQFIYEMRQSSYERDWGKAYDRPSRGERLVAVLLRLLPPIGPLRALHFKMPTPVVEDLFAQSFSRAVKQYRPTLQTVVTRQGSLPDTNLDTGVARVSGKYRLADQTWAEWLHKLADDKFAGLSQPIKTSLLRFYSDQDAPNSVKKHVTEWKEVENELSLMKVAVPTKGETNRD